MKDKTINLNECLEPKSKILTGREYGEEMRDKYKLDALEDEYESIIIFIPDSIYSVNPSFLLGMFGISIRKFGSEDAFLEKYQFDCDETVIESVFDAIDRALKTSDVLRKK